MKFFICILILMFTFNAVAQRRKYRSSSHSLLIQGGANFAKRNIANKQKPASSPPKTGMIVTENFSASYEYRFNDIVSITGGFALNGKGYTVMSKITYINPYDTIIERIKYVQRYQYIDVPLALRFRTEMGRDFYFYGYIGPYMGMSLAGRGTVAHIRADITGLYINKEMTKFEMSKTTERRLDFGYHLGGGVEVKKFFFEVAFAAGLRDINKPSPYIKVRTTNRVMMLSVGYRIRL